MSTTTSPAETAPLDDVIAIAMGLALLSVGTVAAIGGTGLLMWVFGL